MSGSKVRLILALAIYSLISLVLHSKFTSIGDDNVRALLTDWPIHHEIQTNKILNLGKYELIKSNIEPILALKSDETMIPILFQAREGGFSYGVFKLFTYIFGNVAGIYLLTTLLGTLTLLYILLSLKKYSQSFQTQLFLLMCLSPIMIFNAGPYLPDKFLSLFTWMLIYYLDDQKKHFKKLITIIALGLFTKITFLWNISIALVFTGKYIFVNSYLKSAKYKTLTLATLAISAIFFFSFKDQILFELWHDHQILKGSLFYERFLTSLFYLLSSPGMYLHYFTNNPVMSIEFYSSLIIPAILLFTYFSRIRTNSDFSFDKKLILTIVIYSLWVILSIYERSNFSDFLSDIHPFIILLVLFSCSKINKKLVNIVTVLYVAISLIWIHKYQKHGPTDEISIPFHEQVVKEMKRNDHESLLVTQKFDLGIVDYLSNDKIKTIYFDDPELEFKQLQNICILKYYYFNWGQNQPLSLDKLKNQMRDSKEKITNSFTIRGRFNKNKAYIVCK